MKWQTLVFSAVTSLCVGCASVDVQSLPSASLVDNVKLATLLDHHHCATDAIAAWNSAEGDAVFIRGHRGHDLIDVLVYRCGSPDPEVLRGISGDFAHAPLPRGRTGRDWFGQKNTYSVDQSNSVAAVTAPQGAVTHLFSVRHEGPPIATLEMIGTPLVFVRQNRVLLVTYTYDRGQEVIVLNRTTGVVDDRWKLPGWAEFAADMLDPSRRYLLLVARPLPVVTSVVVFDTTSGDLRCVRMPPADHQQLLFLSDGWFLPVLMTAE